MENGAKGINGCEGTLFVVFVYFVGIFVLICKE